MVLYRTIGSVVMDSVCPRLLLKSIRCLSEGGTQATNKDIIEENPEKINPNLVAISFQFCINQMEMGVSFLML